MRAKWNLKQKISQEDQSRFPELPELATQLLFNRGIITSEAVNSFLYPDYSRDIHDPYLLRDMRLAVDRIFSALLKKEKIVVHGDYDADGVCSAAVVMTTLEALGATDFHIFLPHREKDGYGLNSESVQHFIEEKVNLVITTDCGVANRKEIQEARDHQVDVIITDHHKIQENLPDAFAIIHHSLDGQDYPCKNLAGVGMAFKLAQGLIQEARKRGLEIKSFRFGENSTWEGFEKWLLDLVAIATVTDMMLLQDENRTLVKYGLLVLNKTKRIGLRELIEKASKGSPKSIDTWNIGFLIGPRLNATGRLDSSFPSYEILMTENIFEAKRFSEILETSNQERQMATQKICEEARLRVEESKDDFFVAAFNAKWPVGVIGLAAGRLVQEYHLPAIVCSEIQGEIRGSGRSIPQFDMFEALQKLEKYCSRFGGHSQACGFTLNHSALYQEFVEAFRDLAKESLQGKDLILIRELDAQIALNDITWEFYEYLEHFEPFGIGNPRPLFLLENVEVSHYRFMGNKNQHIRLTITDGKLKKNVVGFSKAEIANELVIGTKISLVVEIQKNVYNGNAEIQLLLIDWKIL